MTLGEGFDPSNSASGGNGPTNNVCVEEFSVDINPVLQRTGRWFIAHASVDFESKLSGSLAGKVPGQVVNIGFKHDLEELYLQAGAEGTVIGAIFGIQTVRRNLEFGGEGFDPENPDKQSNRCDPADESTQFDTLDTFLAGCGDRYLESELMGGYVMITADVSSFDGQFKADYKASVDVGASTDILSDLNAVDGSISSFLDISAEADLLNFNVSASGIPMPDQALLTQDQTFNLNNWVDYMNQIDNEVMAAVNNGERGRHTAYGAVVDQSFQYYDIHTIDQCSVGGEGFGTFQAQISCYTDFWRQDANTYGNPQYDPYSAIDYEVEQVRWKLANPNRVRWADPEADTIQEYEDALKQYEDCKTTERYNAYATCQDARQHDVENLCDACQFSSNCSEAAITNRFNSLANSSILPPAHLDSAPPQGPAAAFWSPHATRTIDQGEDIDIRTIDDYVCVFSGMGGKMEGLGEGLRVKPNGSGYWGGQVWSGRSDPAEYIHMDTICAPRTNFRNGIDTDWHQDTMMEFYAEPGSDVDTSPYAAQENSVLAIAGLSGRMKGGGERYSIDFQTPSDTSLIEGVTQQGGLYGYVSAFGLAQTQVPRFTSGGTEKVNTALSGSGKVEARLGPSKASLCFIEELAGKFDGSGESVTIEEREDYWWLVAKAGCNDRSIWTGECIEYKSVQATARCYSYDQTAP